MPFPEGTDYDLIASTFVNPLTVCGFIDTLQKAGATAVVHDAAASQLGT